MKRERHHEAVVCLLLAAASTSVAAACGDEKRHGSEPAGGNAGAGGAAEPATAGSGGSQSGTAGAGGTANPAGGDGGGASTADAGEAGSGGAPAALPDCDEDLKSLELGPDTTITLVHAFSAGSALVLTTPVPDDPPITPVDLCVVKLNIGPGNAGPSSAPSTSAGIGVEIWLPTRERWNGRYQALGNGGLAGGSDVSSLTALGAMRPGPNAAFEAGDRGYVTSINDGGHTNFDGSFAMLPDGTLNEVLLADFADRATHEMAQSTKALIEKFYGKAPEFSYFNGCSEGGREGLMEVQRHPTDFDGLLVGAPALHFDRLNVSALWPQVVMRVDLGGPIAKEKLLAATAAANAACSKALTGQPDGYITDPTDCRYDPTTDTTLLCAAAGGTNATAACLTLAEAKAINKIWYGPTNDGAAPAPNPSTDNGRAPHGALATGQLWFGINRGTALVGHPIWDGQAGQEASPIGPVTAALALGDPTIAPIGFTNASGNGADHWKTLGYAGFVAAFEAAHDPIGRMLATDDPDLSAFAARGGRLLVWHGTGDSLISPQGTVRYYEAVVAQAGGYTEAQRFARFYLGPGFDHCFMASVPGTNPPAPGEEGDPGIGLFPKLIEWVEEGTPPDQLAARSAPDVTPVRSRPWCLYPKRLKYVSGDVNAGTFTCEQ
jgi:feruloyl esterase